MANPCRIAEAVKLGSGGDQDWLRSRDLLVFDRYDSADVYQVYTSRPDGSAETCLTCTARAGQPRVDRHKTNPIWHPSGQFVVLQAELDSTPLSAVSRIKIVSELVLNGLWNDLYAVTADGRSWYRLTNTTTSKTDGVLGPTFSPDGKQLLWTNLVGPAGKDAPWGTWRMMLADFVVTDGVPALRNVRDITPAGAKFVESGGFSPDNRSIVFTGDMTSQGQWDPHIWTMELATGKLVDLTPNTFYHEHPRYSLNGRNVVYMSSQPYPGTVFKTELLQVRADGSDRRQLTYFNVPGHPEHSSEQGMPARLSWNADGTRIAVTVQLALRYPARELWILTFAGPCGQAD